MNSIEMMKPLDFKRAFLNGELKVKKGQEIFYDKILKEFDPKGEISLEITKKYLCLSDSDAGAIIGGEDLRDNYENGEYGTVQRIIDNCFGEKDKQGLIELSPIGNAYLDIIHNLTLDKIINQWTKEVLRVIKEEELTKYLEVTLSGKEKSKDNGLDYGDLSL